MIGHFFFFSIQICASMSPPRKDTLPRRFPHSPLWFFTICNPDSPIIFITYYNDTSTICLPVCSISHNELQDPPQGKGYMHNCFISQGKPIFPRVFRVWEIVCRWMNVKMINSGHGCRRDLSRKKTHLWGSWSGSKYYLVTKMSSRSIFSQYSSNVFHIPCS